MKVLMANLNYQRRDCAKYHDCGVNKTLKIIGSKWTMHILHNLFDGPKRFGELQRNADGISPKTLTLRLRELEKDKVITKKVLVHQRGCEEYAWSTYCQ